MVGRKGRVETIIIDHDTDVEEGEDDFAAEGEADEFDMRGDSPGNAYGEDLAQAQDLEPPQISPAKRRRSTEGEQEHVGKRRRQVSQRAAIRRTRRLIKPFYDSQAQTVPLQKARSRDVSVAGSDAQHAIDVDE